MSRSTDRREFLLDAAKMACGVGAVGLGLGMVAKQAIALPAGPFVRRVPDLKKIFRVPAFAVGCACAIVRMTF